MFRIENVWGVAAESREYYYNVLVSFLFKRDTNIRRGEGDTCKQSITLIQ